jgi:hypothetical protein
MAATVFDGNGNGLRISNDKAKMVTNTSGGGWRRRVSAFDGSNGQSWLLVFDGGNGQQLWQQWKIETVFNGGGGGGI